MYQKDRGSKGFSCNTLELGTDTDLGQGLDHLSYTSLCEKKMSVYLKYQNIITSIWLYNILYFYILIFI